MIYASERTIYTLDWDAIRAFVEARDPVWVEVGLLDDWNVSFEAYRDGVWTIPEKPFVGSFRSRSGLKAELPNGDVVEVAAMRPETAEEAEAYNKHMQAGIESMRDYLKEQA